MSMNLPKYTTALGEAHDDFRNEIGEAMGQYNSTVKEAADKLEERSRRLRVEFFESDEDRAVELAPRKFA